MANSRRSSARSRQSMPPGSIIDKNNVFAPKIFQLITENDHHELENYMEGLGVQLDIMTV
jgi:hypothetical protein